MARSTADRYFRKMVWYALGPLVASDLPRALDLAQTTALPTLADSITWFAARTTAGRALLAQRVVEGSVPVAAAGPLRLLAFALEADSGLTAPARWSEVARFAQATGPEQAALEQLSVLFSDQAMIRVRARVADRTAPLAERRRALGMYSAAPTTRPQPGCSCNCSPMPTSAAHDSPCRRGRRRTRRRRALGLLAHFGSFSAGERSAALAALTSRPALARPLLAAVAAGTFARRRPHRPARPPTAQSQGC
jgi:hypothetical protein